MAIAHGPGWAAADASPVHLLQHSPRHLTPMDPTGPPRFLAREPPIHADVPPPNPPFVFPASLPSPFSAPPTFSRASGRRPMSAIEPHNKPPSQSPENGDRPRRPVALPAFTFNPGASLPPGPNSLTLASPPITPNSSSSRLVPSPSRPGRHGHHRGGSEFVGGSIRDGNSIAVTSISPTKSSSGFASPGLAPLRSHRRGISGAISTDNLPLHPLLDPAVPKGSSAPNTLTAFELREGIPIPAHDQLPGLPEPARPFETNRRPGNAAPDATVTIEPATPSSDAESSILRQARPGRARVSFSDQLEFIPRPLSLVSSDTSSTDTARPGHSVSGSISIVSAASQGGGDSRAPLSRTSTRELFDCRPSTAGPILERTANPEVDSPLITSPRCRNSIPTLLAVADEQPVGEADAPTTKFPKRSFFGLESPFTSYIQRPLSCSSSESVSRAVSGASSSDHESDSTETGTSAPATAKKTGKKTSRMKVKGWAGSILPRKPRGNKKRHKVGEVRPPTFPASVGHWDDVEDGEVAYTEGSGAELAAPEVAMTESPKTALDFFNQRPRSRDDASYPMIDMDAALGPFNTPVAQNPEWEAAQRAAGNPGKKRMHSARGMKGFSGPGMHYHRRAESAPDLPPSDPGRSGIYRFSSNSTMADVFEEDEDDNDVALGPNQHNRHEAAAVARFLGKGSDEGESTPPATMSRKECRALSGSSSDTALGGLRRTNSGPSEAEKAVLHSVRAECSMTSLQDEVIVEEPPSIYRSANMLRSGPDSAASSPKRLAGTKELFPVEVNGAYTGNAGGVPISPYSASHVSSRPSPRSPMSVDAQRISTAPLSITDKNSFQSLLMGEPGPEVRISADYDLRSLTSSNSTMTRDSTFMSNPRLSQPSLREQRPVSVSSDAFGRRRASLVSLSRLISSSHGERSKLSMELTLDNEADNKKSRSNGSKAKQRLGRMMQFWKNSKEGAPT